jgi:hypothetical protein
MAATRTRYLAGLSKNTVLLAVASLFADISSEMLYPILPIFLTQTLHASGSVVGLVEGIAEATQNVVQGFSGWLSDRLQKRKSLALAGYFVSALSPLERAAFLLHDVFDFSFSEVATALERREAACRQLAVRAREHVRAARPRGVTAQASSRGIDAKPAQLLSAFTTATQSGDLNALKRLLASDGRVITDGGGRGRAALSVIEGADRAAQFLVDATRKRPGAWWRDDFTLRFATVNGLPDVIVDAPEGPVQTAAFEIEGDVIRAAYVVRNPDATEIGPGRASAC